MRIGDLKGAEKCVPCAGHRASIAERTHEIRKLLRVVEFSKSAVKIEAAKIELLKIKEDINTTKRRINEHECVVDGPLAAR